MDERTGESWCVDPQGEEIDGTRTPADQTPSDCSTHAKIPSTPQIPAHHEFTDACVHWGGVWYKTFDGQVYGYGGEGPWTLFTTQDGLLTVNLLPENNHGSLIARRWVEFKMTDVTSGTDVVFTLRYKVEFEMKIST